MSHEHVCREFDRRILFQRRQQRSTANIQGHTTSTSDPSCPSSADSASFPNSFHHFLQRYGTKISFACGRKLVDERRRSRLCISKRARGKSLNEYVEMKELQSHTVGTTRLPDRRPRQLTTSSCWTPRTLQLASSLQHFGLLGTAETSSNITSVAKPVSMKDEACLRRFQGLQDVCRDARLQFWVGKRILATQAVLAGPSAETSTMTSPSFPFGHG